MSNAINRFLIRINNALEDLKYEDIEIKFFKYPKNPYFYCEVIGYHKSSAKISSRMIMPPEFFSDHGIGELSQYFVDEFTRASKVWRKGDPN